MDYDALLKFICTMAGGRLIQKLTGSAMVEQLTTDLKSIERRTPDIVVRLRDGRILHLEIQTTNEAVMAWRMLMYWIMLRSLYPTEVIVQIVMYIGSAPLRMPGGYDHPELKYEYRLVDVRDLLSDDFISSELPEERILAMLCSKDPRRAVRRILGSWQGFAPKRWRSLIEQLMVISNLRSLERLVAEEVRLMPLPLELIMKNEVFMEWMQKGLEKGVREGKADSLAMQLSHRFGVLPAWAEERIAAASADDVDRWLIRTLDASTLEESLS